jgi:hypothetical protein
MWIGHVHAPAYCRSRFTAGMSLGKGHREDDVWGVRGRNKRHDSRKSNNSNSNKAAAETATAAVVAGAATGVAATPT